ncbi:MAG: nuclear transport factor 2 family protein [Gemmatimonadales bacterium]
MNPLATAKALYAAFIAHDMPGIMKLLENDIVWMSYGPDFALATGVFKGLSGVEDFFAKLIGPNGQQVDTLFKPMLYFEGGGSVHVIGIESGTLTGNIANGKYTGKTFYNDFDHTLWFGASGKISRFRANYQLSLNKPATWPPADAA